MVKLRKLWLPFAAAALVAGGGDTAAAKAKAIDSPKCVITKVSVNSESGAVAASGRCVLKGKRVPVKWLTSYRTYDHDGYICGTSSTRGSSRVFRIQPQVAHRAVARINLHPRSGKGKASRLVHVKLGGSNLQCGKPVNLPPASVLCSWQTPWPGQVDFANCGIPNTMAAWKTAPTLTGNKVSSGHVTTRSGLCRVTTDRIGRERAYAGEWLGYRIQEEHATCIDGMYFRIRLLLVAMTNPAGSFCWGGPRINMLRSFSVPPSWGGKLHVAFALSGIDGHGTSDPKFSYQSQSATFDLPGTEDGCPQLTGR